MAGRFGPKGASETRLSCISASKQSDHIAAAALGHTPDLWGGPVTGNLP